MSIARRITENLALWRASALEGLELSLLQLQEAGHLAGRAYPQGAMDIRALRIPPQTPPSNSALPLEALLRELQIEEQMAFCRGFLEGCPQFSREDALALPTAAPPASPRVVFWDNYFGREALRRFKEVLPLPRPVTAPSFTAVCEELAGGNADFALLPLGDSREGKLLHLYEEIDRFELRITHTCDVPYPDEGRSISIALLSRLYTPVAKSAGEQLLTLALLDEDGHTLQGVLAAASIAGLSLVRIDSLPAPYGEDGVIYHPIFRVEGDPRLFECFLAICHPRARIVAKYRHLKAKENV